LFTRASIIASLVVNQVNIEGYAHDRLTCDFLQEYLGNEYVDIFKSGNGKEETLPQRRKEPKAKRAKIPA